MIKKSLFTSLLLFFVYSYFAVSLRPGLFAPMSLMQQNKMLAELYIATGSFARGVVVGSSMGTRLKMQHLPAYLNLSMGGFSIYDGFNIIHSKKTVPPIVLVESNVLLRFENMELKKFLASKWRRKLHKKFPVFMAGKEPLNIFALYFQNCCVRTFLKRLHAYKCQILNGFEASDRQIATTFQKKKTDKKNTVQAPASYQKTPFYKKSLSLQIEENSKKPDPDLMTRAITRLKQEVLFLQEKGALVVFFEMPMDPRLCYLETPKTYRKRLHLEFPNIPFVPQPDCSLYYTADAVHLEPVSAEKYTKYLKKHVDAILRQSSFRNLSSMSNFPEPKP